METDAKQSSTPNSPDSPSCFSEGELVLERYQIVGFEAQGAWGEEWGALDTRAGDKCTLAVLPAALLQNPEALDALRFQPGPTAERVAAVLKSAAANGENNHALDPTRLRVVRAYADQAVELRRFRARSRGRVGHVRRPASHITIVVDEQE